MYFNPRLLLLLVLGIMTPAETSCMRPLLTIVYLTRLGDVLMTLAVPSSKLP